MSLQKALALIERLVHDFDTSREHYLNPRYSEAAARKDFIDKFWAALGWDVDHIVDKNPYEQEVKIELNIDVKGRKKRADYAFCYRRQATDPSDGLGEPWRKLHVEELRVEATTV